MNSTPEIIPGAEKMDRRVRRSRAAIRAAFLDLLMEKEYTQITVKELAARADVNRKTFYTHYSSLDDVLSEVEAIYAAELERTLDRAQFFDKNAARDHVLSCVEGTVTRHYEVLRRLSKARSLEYIRRRVEHTTSQVVERKLAQLPSVPEKLRPYAAQQLAAGVVAAFIMWMNAEEPVPFADLAAISEQMILRGLAGLRG